VDQFDFSAKFTLTYQNGVLSFSLSLSAQWLQSDPGFAASGTVQLQVSAKGRGSKELVRLELRRSGMAHMTQIGPSRHVPIIFSVYGTLGEVIKAHMLTAGCGSLEGVVLLVNVFVVDLRVY